MGKSLDEQETTITWLRNDEYASIYSSDSTMITRFDKFVATGDWEVIREERVLEILKNSSKLGASSISKPVIPSSKSSAGRSSVPTGVVIILIFLKFINTSCKSCIKTLNTIKIIFIIYFV